MRDFLLLLLCSAIGYLLGNLHTSVLLSRLMYHGDIREYGSHNAGTTNMIRVFGFKPGAVTFAGDMAKGAAAALIGTLIFGKIGGAICGLSAVLGHDYPVFFGFKGGKGVASTLGVAWVLNPLGGAVVTIAEALGILVFRRVSVGSMVAVGILAVSMFFIDIELTPLFCVLFALVMLRHTENIKRLIAGAEPRIGERKPPKEL